MQRLKKQICKKCGNKYWGAGIGFCYDCSKKKIGEEKQRWKKHT